MCTAFTASVMAPVVSTHVCTLASHVDKVLMQTATTGTDWIPIFRTAGVCGAAYNE